MTKLVRFAAVPGKHQVVVVTARETHVSVETVDGHSLYTHADAPDWLFEEEFTYVPDVRVGDVCTLVIESPDDSVGRLEEGS